MFINKLLQERVCVASMHQKEPNSCIFVSKWDHLSGTNSNIEINFIFIV